MFDLVAVYTPATDVKFYKNGVSVATHATAIPSGHGETFVPFSFSYGGNGGTFNNNPILKSIEFDSRW